MTDSVPEALEGLRMVADRWATDPGVTGTSHAAEVPTAFPSLVARATALDPSDLQDLAARGAALEPWNQGPFPLGQGDVVGAAERDHERWEALAEHVPAQLAGLRVLVVGCGAGYDAFAFAARGADRVLACEPSDAFRQAQLLESVYRSGVDFRQAHWSSLDPAVDGRFDLVHCHGLLHRVLDPMSLLRRLRSLTASGGILLIGSMMLGDYERSEYLRFIPDRHAGDPTWWFVPGRLAFRWLVQTAGFDVECEFGETEGPREALPVVSGYLRALTGADAVD